MITTRPFALADDTDLLAGFLTRQPWPFHVRERWSRDQGLASAADGSWAGPHTHSHWLLLPASTSAW